MALDFRSDIELTNTKTLPIYQADKVKVTQQVSLQNMMPLAGGIDLKTFFDNTELKTKFFTETQITIGDKTIKGYKLNINKLVSVGRYFCDDTATANKIIAIGGDNVNDDIIKIDTINTTDASKTGLIFDVIVSNRIGNMTHDKSDTIDSSERYYMQTLRVYGFINGTDGCIIEWRRHMYGYIAEAWTPDKEYRHYYQYSSWKKCVLPVTETEEGTEYTFLPNFKSNTVTTDKINASGGDISDTTITRGHVHNAFINGGGISSATIRESSVYDTTITHSNSGYPNKQQLFGDDGILKDIDDRLKGLGFKGGYELKNNDKPIGRVAQIGNFVYGYLNKLEMTKTASQKISISLPTNINKPLQQIPFIYNYTAEGGDVSILLVINTNKTIKYHQNLSAASAVTYPDRYYFWYETASTPTIDNAKQNTITETVAFTYTGISNTQTHVVNITVSDFIVENSTITAEFTDSTVTADITSCSRVDAHTIHIKIVDPNHAGKSPRYEVKITYTYDTNIH